MLRASFERSGSRRLRVPLAETIDAALGVHQALLARVKRVAGAADVDGHLLRGRSGLERVPAGAGHGEDVVLGVDAGFHGGVRTLAPEPPTFKLQHGRAPGASKLEGLKSEKSLRYVIFRGAKFDVT